MENAFPSDHPLDLPGPDTRDMGLDVEIATVRIELNSCYASIELLGVHVTNLIMHLNRVFTWTEDDDLNQKAVDHKISPLSDSSMTDGNDTIGQPVVFIKDSYRLDCLPSTASTLLGTVNPSCTVSPQTTNLSIGSPDDNRRHGGTPP